VKINRKLEVNSSPSDEKKQPLTGTGGSPDFPLPEGTTEPKHAKSLHQDRIARGDRCKLHYYWRAWEDQMKRNMTVAIVTGILITLALPAQLAAQHPRYKLIDLGTLGGPTSIVCISCFDGQFFASGIVNERGTTVGFADTSTPDPFRSDRLSDAVSAMHV
jgi:hypothetical protein